MELFPEQIRDAAFLASRSFAGDFSLPGAGKTRTALEATAQVTEPGDLVVIIGPPISLTMWCEEFEDHLHGRSAQWLKTGKTKVNPRADALVMSYAIAVSRASELRQLRIRVLICDESHALKSIDAQRTKAILGRDGICEAASFAWMLTGTPSTRYNDDMFPFLCRAARDQLTDATGGNSMQKFKLRYCVEQKRMFPGARFPKRVVVGNKNTGELNEMIFGTHDAEGTQGGHQVACRRDLRNMPELTVSRLTVEMKIDKELRAALKEADRMSVTEMQAAMATREPSLSSLRRRIGEAKVHHSVMELHDRLVAGDVPILVGAWHTSVIDSLHDRLKEKGWRVALIDGRTPAKIRNKLQDMWNANELDVLVGQISAMGVSLNLQHGGAHRIVTVEQDWSPDIMDQFYARLRRTGQAHQVHVDVFEGDVKIEKALRRISGTKKREHAKLMEQH